MVGKTRALMGNIAHIHTSNLNSSGYMYGSPPGFQGFAGGGYAGNVAGVLDFSAVASYHVSPHFLVRGGYQLLYIPGLDLAPGQLDDTIHRGGVFLHGPMAVWSSIGDRCTPEAIRACHPSRIAMRH